MRHTSASVSIGLALLWLATTFINVGLVYNSPAISAVYEQEPSYNAGYVFVSIDWFSIPRVAIRTPWRYGMGFHLPTLHSLVPRVPRKVTDIVPQMAAGSRGGNIQIYAPVWIFTIIFVIAWLVLRQKGQRNSPAARFPIASFSTSQAVSVHK
jgi:hypothetical protein